MRSRKTRPRFHRQAGDQKRQQYSPGHIQPVAIGAAAGGHAGPKRERVGGVRCNRRYADEQQSGKGQKTASTRDRVQSSAQDAGGKKEDGIVRESRVKVYHKSQSANPVGRQPLVMAMEDGDFASAGQTEDAGPA